MNKIIIAASIVGAAAAGVILYLRKRNSAAGQLEDAAEHANHVAKSHIRKVNHKLKEALA